MKMKLLVIFSIVILLTTVIFFTGCINNKQVPYLKKWGIYSLDHSTQKVKLIYSSDNEIMNLKLNKNGATFVFSMKINGSDYNKSEICTLNQDGTNFQRLTNNEYWDLYPIWSPDSTEIAFLSFRENDLDIYKMNIGGSDQIKFYDSGYHDADIHWIDDYIVFTSESKIWRINDNGTNPKMITDPPRAGEWGNANLPFGDYDPNIHPEGTWIAFERLEDDTSLHGNYNIFKIRINGTNETRLTNNYYSQGFPTWSNSGEKILLIVSAISDNGKYDLYMMNADGSDYKDITPDYFPEGFLCHSAVFSPDDSYIFFIGEWWDYS